MFNPKEHLMDLKGKDYMEVKWRLVWFREEKPLWSIDTKLEQLTENHAVFSAKIYDENGVQKSAGYGSESIKDFRDFIEKAETKAVGRALAMLGYGTQFAPEMEEGDRIVDAPVERKKPAKQEIFNFVCSRCGKEIKGYKGKNGKVMTPEDHINYTKAQFGQTLCLECAKAALAEKRQAEEVAQ